MSNLLGDDARSRYLYSRLEETKDELATAHAEIAELQAEIAALKARETRRRQLRKLVCNKPRTHQ